MRELNRDTVVHRAFAQARRILPHRAARAVRAGATALITPFAFSYYSGHWRAALRERAVSATGEPLPWYTYPAIDFLTPRRHLARRVLEFGAGQSTLWWAQTGADVVALEGDAEWCRELRERVPANVTLHHAARKSPACERDVRAALQRERPFDVVVIDGLDRPKLCPIAMEMRAPGGIIICDNADGYRLHDIMSRSGLNRVDFWGHCPGVMMPHCTSIYFDGGPWFAAGVAD